MKQFLTSSITSLVFAALFAPTASARADNLPDDALSVTHIAGTISGVSALCPEGVVCITGGTTINLLFNLGGCVDELLPLTYKTVDINGVRNVFIDAINVQTAGSLVTRCNRAPTENTQISLINYYGRFKLHFLGTAITRSHQGLSADVPATIVCREAMDHGLTVTFYADADGKIDRAELVEVSFFDSVRRSLNVCNEIEQDSAERARVTYVCNDTDWQDGRRVELSTAGRSGRRSVNVYKTGSQSELLTTIQCR